ncbi:hypothetical protein CBW65_12040 [Tumebacillus avium]|uniref:FTP domain-containing protein n=1 Tax=Tumebacillus avium TaxID=1903704 RepID=A0A1Y0IMC9_9BACL|nr:hypothetical protein [Tumebacillus avium]ARU61667.1 hypothetical protein CBW65_12040 [Tumebacillus avium]
MKKVLGTLTVACLALLTVTTTGQASNEDLQIKNELKAKGHAQVEKVETKIDTITVIDKKGNPLVREPKKTNVIDLEFSSNSEINEKYGDIIADIYKQKGNYKNKTKSEYIKINIFRDGELVAYLVLNEKNERTFKIIDYTNITSLGMGMPLPSAEHERQEALVKRVAEQEGK